MLNFILKVNPYRLVYSRQKRATHQWDYSLNKVNRARLPPTLEATTRVMGLTPGAKYQFRHRIHTKNGEGNWEMTKAFRVAGFDEN